MFKFLSDIKVLKETVLSLARDILNHRGQMTAMGKDYISMKGDIQSMNCVIKELKDELAALKESPKSDSPSVQIPSSS